MSSRQPAFFYQFLALHSLLIGLLPFFLPVYLWQHGLGLGGLCLLVGVSGVSFISVLGLWQLICRRYSTRLLITITFVLELLLVVVVGLITTVPGAALFTQAGTSVDIPVNGIVTSAICIGLANGVYNAFFWTTQRSLFMQILGENDTGKQYGNFQIFVTLFLKAGILLGGLLLETSSFVWLLALSAGIGFAGNTWLNSKSEHQPILTKEHTSLAHSLRYRDDQGSREVFMIDGLFLYLESHFWTLSLFLIVRQDYSRLGLAVVILALVFGAAFLIIKNRIDRLPVERVYQTAVWLYAASWVLRFTLDGTSENSSVLAALILITFSASFFRLAFNKRFFDVARHKGTIEYLLIKSYSSQCYLGVMFLLFGIPLVLYPSSDVLILQYLYLPASLISLAYLRYRQH